MKITKTPLYDYVQTIKEIYRLSHIYHSDLKPFDDMTFEEFFNFVTNIPYTKDGNDEVVKRPKFVIDDNRADCKKKSILIGAFCVRHGIPVRWVVMSTQRDKSPHHIYNEVYNNGRWITADATYRGNSIGQAHKGITYWEAWR